MASGNYGYSEHPPDRPSAFRQDELHRITLAENQGDLVEQLSLNATFTSHLLQNGILTIQEETDLQAMQIPSDKSRKFVNILKAKGPPEFHAFLHVLREQGMGFLADKLFSHYKLREREHKERSVEEDRPPTDPLERKVARRENYLQQENRKNKDEIRQLKIYIRGLESEMESLKKKTHEQKDKVEDHWNEPQEQNKNLEYGLHDEKHTVGLHEHRELNQKQATEAGEIEQLREEISKMRKEFASQQDAGIDALKQKHDREFKALKHQHDSEIKDLKHQHDSEIKVMKLQRDTETKPLKQQRAMQMDARGQESSWMQKQRAMEQKHKAELDAQRDEWKRKLHQSNNAILRLKADVKKLNKQISDLKNNHR